MEDANNVQQNTQSDLRTEVNRNKQANAILETRVSAPEDARHQQNLCLRGLLK
ncbi:Hypothetical predicted protein, partial [Pelobates cultripes]